jgi:hypothetical protein
MHTLTGNDAARLILSVRQHPLDRVASISAALACSANLHVGAARAALRKAVLSARNGDPS